MRGLDEELPQNSQRSEAIILAVRRWGSLVSDNPRKKMFKVRPVDLVQMQQDPLGLAKIDTNN